MSIETAQDALNVLTEWNENNPGEISYTILQWTRDYFENTTSATALHVLDHLWTINCAACHAPKGLIYDKQIADKVPLWWHEINEALANYFEETGEHARPSDGAITVGWLVWFAVECIGHNAALYLESKMEG